MGEGKRTIRLYLFGFYAIPLLYGVVFGFEHLSYLKGAPDYWVGAFYILAYVILLSIWLRSPRLLVGTQDLSFNFFLGQPINLAIALFYLFLTYKFHSEYGLEFRHSGIGMSNTSGGYVIIMTVLQYYFNAYIILQLAQFACNFRVLPLDRVVLLVILLCRLWSLATSFDAIVVFVIFMLAFPFFGARTMLLQMKSNIGSVLPIYTILFLVALAVYFIGVANKIGVERAIEWFQTYSFYDLTSQFMQRLSIFLYSTMYHATFSFADVNFSPEAIAGTIQNFAYRIGLLTGLDFTKPDVQSAGRMNALYIYTHPNPHVGASPGLIGSTFFFAPFPLGLFISLVVVKWLIFKVNDIFSGGCRLSLISLAYMVITIETIIDATTDLVNPLESGPIQLFFIYLVWLNRHHVWSYDCSEPQSKALTTSTSQGEL